MLNRETFAIIITLINGILFDKHKILERTELDVYYESLKDEIDNEALFIESIKQFIKKWNSSYKRPSPFEILNFYKDFKKEKEEYLFLEKQIKEIKKLNKNLLEKK